MKVVSKVAPAKNYEAHKVAVDAHLASLGAGVETTFDEIRAALGLTKVQLPDGHIHQLAIDGGYVVRP